MTSIVSFGSNDVLPVSKKLQMSPRRFTKYSELILCAAVFPSAPVTFAVKPSAGENRNSALLPSG